MNSKAKMKTISDKEALYDRLYVIGDFLLKKHNPCKIKKGKCSGPFRTEFCCDDCRYIINKGCSIKCLWCKLWLCGVGSDHLLRQFKTLNHLAKINYLIHPRRPKKYAMSVVRRSQRRVTGLLIY